AVVMALVIFERGARRRRSYANDAQQPRVLRLERLGRGAGLLAVAFAMVPVLVGFVIPATYLVDASVRRIHTDGMSPAILLEVRNTVIVSLVGTIVTMVAALVVVYADRLHRQRLTMALSRVASIGYAVPGVVLAIGMLPVITGVNLWILTSGVAI